MLEVVCMINSVCLSCFNGINNFVVFNLLPMVRERVQRKNKNTHTHTHFQQFCGKTIHGYVLMSILFAFSHN